ncbi:hypothetical protein B0J11DRAFT_481865 [Dendryphion nanum]|uniref:Uncharacterized protein n=1 Tax=Dendryphion nanum TaxID=256645 RepID=A0A9P9IRH1_9PLEO|nr:hypothetical protein B0J11DRAFT_481865 [Dendryphion nanum]
MAANGIPLHCNICPRKPNFSDVSHLLTHIASKGHLSNYFKVKVRSNTEEASRRVIETYDRWYAEWNVDDLMSERMSQKDKRRTRVRPAGKATVPRSTRGRAAGGSLLDPRLSEQNHQMIKVEHSATPTPTPYAGPVLRHRSFAPRVHYWPMDSRSTSQSYTNPDYETSSEYSEPSARKRSRYTVEDSCAIEDDSVDIPPKLAEDPMAVNESTKLKGVYWPGMDIFDSATPEMRRKRNQKKDSSVVEQLELNSQEVEPTELIFTPQGSFKKQRRISSSEYDIEESSPTRGETPRPYLTRPALANLDVNTNRRSRQHTRSQLARNQYGLDNGRADYGVGNHPPHRRRAFEVFQDDEVSFSQPAGFNYLTAGFRPLHVSPSPGPAFPPYKMPNGLHQNESKEAVLSAYQEPAFDHHHHHPVGYNYHAYAYGLEQDQHAFQYHNHLYMNNVYQHQSHDDADDQRTLTAPPSPSTG